MATLSTHVLDLAGGVPAAGVRVELASLPGGEPVLIEPLVRLEVTDAGLHHHVPVLATPFAASTYLGS